MSFLSDQLTAVMQRSNALGDTVLLMLSSTVAVSALREFGYEEQDPMMGGQTHTKKIQLRFPVAELNGAQLHVDFDIGDRCYIGPPVQLIPEGTFDQAKWELKYYRTSADGLLISVGLDCND